MTVTTRDVTPSEIPCNPSDLTDPNTTSQNRGPCKHDEQDGQ
jgi:hypothetical protein